MPRYNANKIVEKILDHTITYEQISKSKYYEDDIKPRLEAIVCMRDIIENDFKIFSFMPRMYPFTTRIKADYLISSTLEQTNFVFIIKENKNEDSKDNYLCCSAFSQGLRDYETNQKKRTILKKERIHLPTQTSVILYDRLTN